MVLNDKMQVYYQENPLMVSSPFGGVAGVNHALFESVFRELGIDLKGRRVLDIGCGRGFAEEVVNEAGGEYVGLDFVMSRAGFRLVLGDGAHLPLGAATFDAVFCIDAFEHFPEAELAAREFARVLKPGRFVFLSVPNYSNVAGLVKAYCERFGNYEANTWAPFRNWQPQEFEQALTGGRVRRIFASAGFNRLRRMGHAPEVGLGLFPWTEHPKMPEAIKFRLQRLFAVLGPAFVRVWPGFSLHEFWKIEK